MALQYNNVYNDHTIHGTVKMFFNNIENKAFEVSGTIQIQ